MVSRRLHKALQRAQDTKSILRIERKPKFADRVDGIVLRIGEQWILMAQTADGGYFDGYVLLRLRDVARLTPDETFAHEFVRFQPEWPPSFPFDVDLDDTASALSGFARQGELVGIQKENERSAIWIGTPDDVTSRYIYLNEVRPDATWHPRPLGYKLRSITMAEVGTRYLIGLSEVAGAGASSVRAD
ncbi:MULTISPECIES: hypothetical protein [unclassified Microbacterium]|uniref:hypothetical protein n=1 Tax=unclassified Microbacterium TaxID=2609290 RepID=UPI0006FE1E08|nr:hypothetical protein [Microbacterium sp. Root553]KQZ24398.1 hypothetical protein ASD43_08580 [Microbacterium sp. Root553]